MSVQKDPSGRRSIQVEIEVPGTPEEVWQAIATGPGVSSWFVPAEVEGGKDGRPARVISHMGPGMDAVAIPTAWEPPRRFAAESRDLGPNAPSLATEWTVEARTGGTCVVRVVQSLFAGTDDWDDQLESFESGWPGYFAILRLYLAHFRGAPCSAFQVMGVAPEPESRAWEVMLESLGVARVAIGQRARTIDGVPPFDGQIARVGEGRHPHALLVLLDEPVAGIAAFGAHTLCGQVVLMIRFYLYGDHAPDSAARNEPLWRAWMNSRFPTVGGRRSNEGEDHGQ